MGGLEAPGVVGWRYGDGVGSGGTGGLGGGGAGWVGSCDGGEGGLDDAAVEGGAGGVAARLPGGWVGGWVGGGGGGGIWEGAGGIAAPPYPLRAVQSGTTSVSDLAL